MKKGKIVSELNRTSTRFTGLTFIERIKKVWQHVFSSCLKQLLNLAGNDGIRLLLCFRSLMCFWKSCECITVFLLPIPTKIVFQFKAAWLLLQLPTCLVLLSRYNLAIDWYVSCLSVLDLTHWDKTCTNLQGGTTFNQDFPVQIFEIFVWAFENPRIKVLEACYLSSCVNKVGKCMPFWCSNAWSLILSKYITCHVSKDVDLLI